MTEVLEKAILAEVEPGKTYIMAARRGNIDRHKWIELANALALQRTSIFVLETYDNPADCLLFNARKEEIEA